MTKDTYLQILQLKNYDRVRSNFVKMLHENHHVDLKFIDVNDWQCNTRPSVYIHNKNNLFKMRRYFRCAYGDLDRAIKFINR